MEEKKASITAAVIITGLVAVIIVARLSLKLSRAFFLVAGADVALILAVFVCLVIRGRYDRRRKLLEKRLVSESRELRIEYSFLRKVAGVPVKFRLKEVEDATDNFRALLGQGGSASVFKGILSDGTAVAVKRIDGEEHGDKEFRSEVAAIASVQHMIGGQRNVTVIENGSDKSQRKWQYFPKIVRDKLGEGKVIEAVDHRLVEAGAVDERQVKRMVHVALWCIQEKPKLRPSMAHVVEMLEGRVPVEEPPNTQMIVVDLLSIDGEDSDCQLVPKVAAMGSDADCNNIHSSSSRDFPPLCWCQKPLLLGSSNPIGVSAGKDQCSFF
ncbi:hypothetical protein GQ457_12G023650 [Hibiscus cannabinus]